MSIANYSTSIDPAKTAGEIMGMLSSHGATGIGVDYQAGVQTGMTFTIGTEYGPRGFSLPIRVDGVLKAMQQDRSIPRSQCTEKQAARVAWRIAKDWLRAQLALIEAGLASLDEVMMPYMLADSGQTMFQLFQSQQSLITDHQEAGR